MRVMMIAPASSPHAVRPVEELLKLGCEVVFMAAHDPFSEHAAGYSFLKSPSWRGKHTVKRISRNLCKLLDYWFEVWPMKLAWKRLSIDIVHVSWVNEQAARCAEEHIQPLVLTVWGSDINDLFAPNVDEEYRSRIGKALAKADLILVDSSDMIDKCAELAGRSVNVKMQMVGIDTELFKPGYAEEARLWRNDLAIPGSSKVILSVRALAAHYGQREIITAYAQSLPRFTGSTVLVINRFNGCSDMICSPYEMELRELVMLLGIGDHIRWMNPVPVSRLPQVYAAADVVVTFPSKDAFPVTFLEAAACEKPVISSLLPAYKETFAAKYFTMVKKDSISDLSHAMVNHVNSGSTSPSTFLEEARRLIVSDYDKTRTSAQLMARYKEVLLNP